MNSTRDALHLVFKFGFMKMFIAACLLFVGFYGFSQKAFEHKNAHNHAIRTTELDSTYKSAIHSDSTLAVFKNQEEVINAYASMLQSLGNFLYKNNFFWNAKTTGFNRIYFDQDGSIDYFVYSFRAGQLTEEQIARFDELLNLFIQDYRFPLTANEKFAQCSPVTYMPKPSE